MSRNNTFYSCLSGLILIILFFSFFGVLIKGCSQSQHKNSTYRPQYKNQGYTNNPSVPYGVHKSTTKGVYESSIEKDIGHTCIYCDGEEKESIKGCSQSQHNGSTDYSQYENRNSPDNSSVSHGAQMSISQKIGHTCTYCNGTGMVKLSKRYFGSIEPDIRCEICGRKDPHSHDVNELCPMCNGTGMSLL